MSDLRETLAGDDYWSNALVVPPSLYLSEQQTSAFYHDETIRRYHALGQGIILPEIHSLHPQDLPSYATDSLFSIYVHTRYRATSQQLQAVVRSLGPNAVAQTMQSFSTRLTAIEKRTGVTTGARWLDLEAGTLVECDRFYGLNSYVRDTLDPGAPGQGYLIARRGNEMQVAKPQRRANPRPQPLGLVLPQFASNTVIPHVLFGQAIEVTEDPEVTIHRKIISGFLVLPKPPRRTTFIPGQRPSSQS